MIIYESLKHQTPEENEQINKLQAEFENLGRIYSRKIKECINRGDETASDPEVKQARLSLRDKMKQLESVRTQAKKHFLELTPDSELIEHANKCLESLTFEDIVLLISCGTKPEWIINNPDTVYLMVLDNIYFETDFGLIIDYFTTSPLQTLETYTEQYNNLIDKANGLARQYERGILDNRDNLSELFESVRKQREVRTLTPENTPYKLMHRIPDIFSFGVDKVGLEVWKSFRWNTRIGADNQITLQALTAPEKHPSHEDIYVLTSINFNALEGTKLSKKLTAYDKRVYNAIGTFWNKGYSVFSVTQLWRTIGNTGTPSPSQIKKLNDCLTKLRLTQINIDNVQETSHGMKYPRIQYDGVLLPFERVTAYNNKGEICEGAVHLFREPPLFQFARERDQISTVPRSLLLSPINKTDIHLEIEDYLLERISKMKHDKTHPRKILYSTLFENCNITEKKQRQRTPEKVKRYLDYYQQQDEFIKGYTLETDGVTIKI